MILVEHDGWTVKLTPDNIDDNDSLIKILSTPNLFSTPDAVTFTGKSWLVVDSEIHTLNKALIPLKTSIALDESFRKWKQEQNLVTPATIYVGVIDCILKKGGQDIPHSKIEDVCKYFWKPAVNHPNFKGKGGKWDGYIILYRRWEHKFPTGLLHDVELVLQQEGIKYQLEYVHNPRPQRKFDWTICDNITPDPDQYEAIDAAIKGGRGVVKAPTGFGKTAVLAKRLVAAHGVPSLFVANKKTLLDDAAKEFMEGISGLTGVATIKDGWFGDTKLPSTKIKPITAPVVVATIQSLHARLKDENTRPYLIDWLKNTCKFVMVDECQATGTKTWDEVLDECNAPLRIFLSATPRRTDGATLKLMAGSGPLLFTTTAEEQIEKGRLCELEIGYQVYDHKLFNQYDHGIEYHDAYKVFVVENKKRNEEFIVKPTLEMLKEGRHVLVLIQIIEHGHILKDLFIENGISPDEIRFIWGDTPDKLRKSAIDEFKKGEFKIMIGSTIFDAGVNIPIISGVVLGGAGNSDITLIQRIGRGARNCDYGDVLGYLPEFMLQNDGRKVTIVRDILDVNTKFFHDQSINRYKNAKTEFGEKRVHIMGGDSSALRKPSKNTVRLSKDIDQFTAQIEMLQEFISQKE